MRHYKVEILRISSFLKVSFYRRFLPLDVYLYAFGAENAASSSNLPIPPDQTDEDVIFGKIEKDRIRNNEAVSNIKFETAPHFSRTLTTRYIAINFIK